MTRICRIATAMAVAGCLVRPAAAQGPSSDIEAAVRKSPIFLTEANSPAELRGSLLRLGPETLTLLVDGAPRDIPLNDVTRIRIAGDPVKNGAIIGALVLGGWCLIICPQGLDHASDVGQVAAINTVLGALIGAGIDAAHKGRTTIYERGAWGARGRRPSLARTGLAYSFRF